MMKYRIPKIDGQPLTEAERQALIMAARSYLGVPWHHLGNSAHGLDCRGLIQISIRDVLGIAPEIWDYATWPNMKAMREMCNLLLQPINPNEMRAGDVALLYAPGIGVCHLGWIAELHGRSTLIHASNQAHAQKVVEATIHPNWNLRGSYRVPRFVGD